MGGYGVSARWEDDELGGGGGGASAGGGGGGPLPLKYDDDGPLAEVGGAGSEGGGGGGWGIVACVGMAGRGVLEEAWPLVLLPFDGEGLVWIDGGRYDDGGGIEGGPPRGVGLLLLAGRGGP